MPDRVHVRGLVADTIIGIFGWERLVRQTLTIDLELETDFSAAARSDHIEDAIDYKRLSKRVRAWVQSSRYKLVETLAHDIAALCLEDERVSRARVLLHKGRALRFADDVAVEVERRRGEPLKLPAHRVFVGVGSNVDPVENVREGLQRLHEEFGAIRVSEAYRTAPVGTIEGGPFVNLCVGFRTDRDVAELRDLLHRFEADAGRTRTDDPNAPRTLDLDLLLYDDLVEEDGKLPHPQVESMPFVLVPLADIAAEVRHPTLARTIGEMRDRLPLSLRGVEPMDEVLY